jgi:D-alanyl-D-alanine carboxypeptidase
MEISIYDLMFGMMLPSGNNAAYALAQTIGTILTMDATTKFNYELVYDVDSFY